MQAERPVMDFSPDPLPALLAAALFGYYGFLAGLDTSNDAGVVPLWLAFTWTLRISAVLFAVSAGLALARSRASTLVYGVFGALSSAALLGILAWDLSDSTKAIAMPLWLLGIFVLWNGYCAVTAIRSALP